MEEKILSKKKQTRLWGRAILVKEKKEKKPSTPTGLPIARISASAIRDFEKCQKLFYYKYILKLRLPGKPLQLVFGSAFHHGLEAFYEGKDPVKVFKKEFNRDDIDFTKKQLEETPDIFQESLEEGVRLMEIWEEEAKDLHQMYGISMGGTSEVKFENWWKNPLTSERLPIQVTGRYDRITSNKMILEFKTSNKPYRQDEVNVGIQPSIYTFSYETELKVPAEKFLYIVFIKGRKKDPIQVLETTRTREQHSQTFEKIKLILDSLRTKEEKDYRYGEGFMHQYCDCRKYEEQLLL